MSEKISNPELYREMSRRYESAEAASAALEAFTTAVENLRREHRIAEVVLVAAAHHEPAVAEGAGSEQTSQISAMALGDSQVNAQMAAVAFQKFARPIVKMAEALHAVANGA